MLTDANQKGPKTAESGPEEYLCDKCDYATSHLSHWKRHIETKKHNANKMLTNANQKGPKGPKGPKAAETSRDHKHVCECGKSFSHKSSLSRHRGMCTSVTADSASQNQSTTQLIDPIFLTKVIEEVAKAMNGQGTLHHNQMMEVINRVGNHNHVNSHNQQFNINLYLNEQCKDAMTIQAFANSLIDKITESLEQISGDPHKIVALIKDQVKEHTQKERPLHVHDKKWYIKDEVAGWEDDTNGKVIDVVNQVARKNELAKLDTMFPNWENGGKDADGYVIAMQKSQADLSVKHKKSALKALENTCVVDEKK